MKKQLLSRVASALLSCIIVLMLVIIVYAVLSVNDRSVLGYRLFVVETNSMAGTIDPGELIVTRQVPPQSLRQGDIITFLSDAPDIYGKPNTHRIVAVKNGEFYTRGDNTPAVDAYPVPAKNVLGRVVCHSTVAGWVFRQLSRPAVMLLLLIVPLTLLLAGDLRAVFRQRADAGPGGKGTTGQN